MNHPHPKIFELSPEELDEALRDYIMKKCPDAVLPPNRITCSHPEQYYGGKSFYYPVVVTTTYHHDKDKEKG